MTGKPFFELPGANDEWRRGRMKNLQDEFVARDSALGGLVPGTTLRIVPPTRRDLAQTWANTFTRRGRRVLAPRDGESDYYDDSRMWPLSSFLADLWK